MDQMYRLPDQRNRRQPRVPGVAAPLRVIVTGPLALLALARRPLGWLTGPLALLALARRPLGWCSSPLALLALARRPLGWLFAVCG